MEIKNVFGSPNLAQIQANALEAGARMTQNAKKLTETYVPPEGTVGTQNVAFTRQTTEMSQSAAKTSEQLVTATKNSSTTYERVNAQMQVRYKSITNLGAALNIYA